MGGQFNTFDDERLDRFGADAAQGLNPAAAPQQPSLEAQHYNPGTPGMPFEAARRFAGGGLRDEVARQFLTPAAAPLSPQEQLAEQWAPVQAAAEKVVLDDRRLDFDTAIAKTDFRGMHERLVDVFAGNRQLLGKKPFVEREYVSPDAVSDRTHARYIGVGLPKQGNSDTEWAAAFLASSSKRPDPSTEWKAPAWMAGWPIQPDHPNYQLEMNRVHALRMDEAFYEGLYGDPLKNPAIKKHAAPLPDNPKTEIEDEGGQLRPWSDILMDIDRRDPYAFRFMHAKYLGALWRDGNYNSVSNEERQAVRESVSRGTQSFLALISQEEATARSAEHDIFTVGPKALWQMSMSAGKSALIQMERRLGEMHQERTRLIRQMELGLSDADADIDGLTAKRSAQGLTPAEANDLERLKAETTDRSRGPKGYAAGIISGTLMANPQWTPPDVTEFLDRPLTVTAGLIGSTIPYLAAVGLGSGVYGPAGGFMAAHELAAGRIYDESIQAGDSHADAAMTAAIGAPIEAFVELFRWQGLLNFSKASGVGVKNAIIKTLTGKVVKQIAAKGGRSWFQKATAGPIGLMITEGLEESIQGASGELVPYYVSDRPLKPGFVARRGQEMGAGALAAIGLGVGMRGGAPIVDAASQTVQDLRSAQRQGGAGPVPQARADTTNQAAEQAVFDETQQRVEAIRQANAVPEPTQLPQSGLPIGLGIAPVIPFHAAQEIKQRLAHVDLAFQPTSYTRTVRPELSKDERQQSLALAEKIKIQIEDINRKEDAFDPREVVMASVGVGVMKGGFTLPELHNISDAMNAYEEAARKGVPFRWGGPVTKRRNLGGKMVSGTRVYRPAKMFTALDMMRNRLKGMVAGGVERSVIEQEARAELTFHVQSKTDPRAHVKLLAAVNKARTDADFERLAERIDRVAVKHPNVGNNDQWALKSPAEMAAYQSTIEQRTSIKAWADAVGAKMETEQDFIEFYRKAIPRDTDLTRGERARVLTGLKNLDPRKPKTVQAANKLVSEFIENMDKREAVTEFRAAQKQLRKAKLPASIQEGLEEQLSEIKPEDVTLDKPARTALKPLAEFENELVAFAEDIDPVTQTADEVAAKMRKVLADAKEHGILLDPNNEAAPSITDIPISLIEAAKSSLDRAGKLPIREMAADDIRLLTKAIQTAIQASQHQLSLLDEEHQKRVGQARIDVQTALENKTPTWRGKVWLQLENLAKDPYTLWGSLSGEGSEAQAVMAGDLEQEGMEDYWGLIRDAQGALQQRLEGLGYVGNDLHAKLLDGSIDYCRDYGGTMQKFLGKTPGENVKLHLPKASQLFIQFGKDGKGRDYIEDPVRTRGVDLNLSTMEYVDLLGTLNDPDTLQLILRGAPILIDSHRDDGGVQAQAGREKGRRGRLIRLTWGDVVAITQAADPFTGGLTEFLMGYYNDVLPDIARPASERLWGFDMFARENYYRRARVDDLFGKDARKDLRPDPMAGQQIGGASEFHERQGGQTPILIKDAVTRFYGHVDRVARLVALGEKIAIAQKTLGDPLLRNEIEHVYGRDGIKILEKTLQEMEMMGRGPKEHLHSWANVLLGKMYPAALGFKPHIGVYQTLSVQLLLEEMSPKHVLKAAADPRIFSGALDKTIMQSNPTYWARLNGQATGFMGLGGPQGFQNLAGKRGLANAAMWQIREQDKIAMRITWLAVESELNEQMAKDGKRMPAADLYAARRKRYSFVANRTQPAITGNIMSLSGIRRKGAQGDTLFKFMGVFRSARDKMFGSVVRSYSRGATEVRSAKAAFEAAEGTPKEAEAKAEMARTLALAESRMAKTTFNMMSNSMLIAGTYHAWALLSGKRKYEDFEKDTEKIIEDGFKKFLAIPYGGGHIANAVDIWAATFRGGSFFRRGNAGTPVGALAEKIVEAGVEIARAATVEKRDKIQFNQRMFRVIDASLDAIGFMAGLPLPGLRDLSDVASRTATALGGEGARDVEELWWAKPKKKKKSSRKSKKNFAGGGF